MYHLINLIKSEGEDFFVIGSSANSEAIYRLACDEWHLEPDGLSDKDYVDCCLDFCLKNNVDIFIPRRKQAAVSENADRFRDIGTKLMCITDGEVVRRLDE